MRYLSMLVVAGGLCAAACGDGGSVGAAQIDQARWLSGRFPLIEQDGGRVPLDLGPVLNRNPGVVPDCRYILASGYILLDSLYRRFEASAEYRSSCDGRLLSNSFLTGSYDQSGTTVMLSMPGDTPYDLALGWVVGDSVLYVQYQRAGGVTLRKYGLRPPP